MINRKIPAESLDLVDWPSSSRFTSYKDQKKLNNLVIRQEILRKILEKANCTIIADEAVIKPNSFSDRMLLQDAVISVLKKYVDRFYRLSYERWASENMVYTILDINDPNLNFNAGTAEDSRGAYVVKVKKSERELIAAIEALKSNLESLLEVEGHKFPISISNDIYLPFIEKDQHKLVSSPPGLEESELTILAIKRALASRRKTSGRNRIVFTAI